MRISSIVTLTAALVATGGGCASILGVDRDYVLGDSGAPMSDGSKPPFDASEDTAFGIRCDDGGVFCNPRTQECCLASDASLSCLTLGMNACSSTGTDIFCDDSADCDGGQVCCADVDSQNE